MRIFYFLAMILYAGSKTCGQNCLKKFNVARLFDIISIRYPLFALGPISSVRVEQRVTDGDIILTLHDDDEESDRNEVVRLVNLEAEYSGV